MPEISRIGDLDISEDRKFQKREWIVQRVGWAMLALFLIGGLLGVFGTSGPLSDRMVLLPGVYGWLKYNRFLHSRGPASLQVSLDERAISGSEIRVGVGQSYFSHMQVQHITPQPDRVEIEGDDYVYVFRVAESGKPASITFELMVQTVGSVEGTIRIGEGEPLRFEQFVYP